MIENLSLYLLLTFVNCITPGAGVLYTLNNAFRYGKSCWYMSPSGNAAGVFFMSVIAACGIGAVIQASPLLFTLVQIGGCLVMIWLGVRCWRAPTVDLSKAAAVKETHSKNKREIFLSAMLLQTTNPMLIVFVLSFMPQFINRSESYIPQITILIALFVLICLLVHLVYSYLAASSVRFLKGERFSFWLNKISGFLFWLIAAAVLINFFENQPF
jgi:homoserine/homoserine lactone efflux protein